MASSESFSICSSSAGEAHATSMSMKREARTLPIPSFKDPLLSKPNSLCWLPVSGRSDGEFVFVALAGSSA